MTDLLGEYYRVKRNGGILSTLKEPLLKACNFVHLILYQNTVNVDVDSN